MPTVVVLVCQRLLKPAIGRRSDQPFSLLLSRGVSVSSLELLVEVWLESCSKPVAHPQYVIELRTQFFRDLVILYSRPMVKAHTIFVARRQWQFVSDGRAYLLLPYQDLEVV